MDTRSEYSNEEPEEESALNLAHICKTTGTVAAVVGLSTMGGCVTGAITGTIASAVTGNPIAGAITFLATCVPTCAGTSAACCFFYKKANKKEEEKPLNLEMQNRASR